jgi:hypothetical protein
MGRVTGPLPAIPLSHANTLPAGAGVLVSSTPMADNLVRPVRTLPPDLIPERSGATVWWSSITRKGEWILPRIYRAFAFMGNIEIDLTDARMDPAGSEIEVKCILANVEITVPPDVRVLCDGDGIAGAFEVKTIGKIDPLPVNAPTLRITGTAYLGSVEVKIQGYVGPGWMDKLKAWGQANS